MSARLTRRIYSPHHAPVGTSQQVISGRPSLVVALESAAGTYPGEATPLSGFGRDDFGQAERELSTLTVSEVLDAVGAAADSFSPLAEGEDGLLVGEGSPIAAAEAVSAKFHSPAAKFCVETIILGAAAGSCGVPMGRLLARDRVAPRLPASAVLDGSSAQALSNAEALTRLGIRHFKIKCGRDQAAELDLVKALARFPSAPSLRLDPNRAWNTDEAVRFLQSCSTAVIDWVEDPTNEWSEWGSIADRTGIPVAIDEPLATHAHDVLAASGSSVVVLKPMVLGGIGASLRWTQAARQVGHAVTISHLFDGPTAMDAYIHLAFAVQSTSLAPGLGPHAALDGYASLGQKAPRALRADHLAAPAA